jgi:hypothetical protein
MQEDHHPTGSLVKQREFVLTPIVLVDVRFLSIYPNSQGIAITRFASIEAEKSKKIKK